MAPVISPKKSATAGTLPHREGSLLRSLSECGAAEDSLRAAAGHAGRLSPLRAVGSPPGELRPGKYRLGRRLQRHAHAIRPPRIDRPGLCLLSSLAEAVCRVCRILRRGAGPLSALPDDVGLYPRGERKRSPH